MGFIKTWWLVACQIAVIAFLAANMYSAMPKNTTGVKTARLDSWRFDKMKGYSYLEIESPEPVPGWKIKMRRLKNKATY